MVCSPGVSGSVKCRKLPSAAMFGTGCPLTISAAPGSPITVTVGVPVTNAVFATYTVADSSGAPGTQWRAKILFGDGQVDKQVVPVQVGNEFQFRDTHTYTAAGNMTATTGTSRRRSWTSTLSSAAWKG